MKIVLLIIFSMALIILTILVGYFGAWCSDMSMELKSLKAQQNTIQIMTSAKYGEYIKHISKRPGLKAKMEFIKDRG